MTIQHAEACHVDDVARMMDDFFRFHAELQPDYYRPVEDCTAYPRAALRREEGIFLVAVEGERAVGFLNALGDVTPPFETFIPYRHATVVDLYVAPQHRGRGIGTALLDAAEAWAREEGLSYLELNVLAGNENARRFYEAGGFATTSHVMKRFVRKQDTGAPE